MSPSTLAVRVQQFGTMDVPIVWGPSAASRVMASIMLGIEQASRNEGTILSDTDLETDEDD